MHTGAAAAELGVVEQRIDRLRREGQAPPKRSRPAFQIELRYVTPGYFEALGESDSP